MFLFEIFPSLSCLRPDLYYSIVLFLQMISDLLTIYLSLLSSGLPKDNFNNLKKKGNKRNKDLKIKTVDS